jgi:hypothetical protein
MTPEERKEAIADLLDSEDLTRLTSNLDDPGHTQTCCDVCGLGGCYVYDVKGWGAGEPVLTRHYRFCDDCLHCLESM